ncbi:hypothetical protein TetV_427 [Tetraselmis virus 1]|uniref:Uncharacterized protein n=1 Tax=Tetraselmis virus 1 TaxID=2060617 RepID=A0A2P0VP11_9VIRU|nr:hypothetical protein QJ968_gp627 [Tetraselmis virus 1]AUF82509.1 hypothetical protein TetV_427 [Tetraselmis virus 1]
MIYEAVCLRHHIHKIACKKKKMSLEEVFDSYESIFEDEKDFDKQFKTTSFKKKSKFLPSHFQEYFNSMLK